jgi:hypothetical protein
MRFDAFLIGLVVLGVRKCLGVEGSIDDVCCVEELVFASWTVFKLHLVFCSYTGLGASQFYSCEWQTHPHHVLSP